MIRCGYCGSLLDGPEEKIEGSHEPICLECSKVEFQGQSTRLEFDTAAYHVRRTGKWYLEGRDNEGRTFIFGEIHAPKNPDNAPTRLWQRDTNKCEWDVDFLDMDDPHRSRKIDGSTPQRCVFCQTMIEAEFGWEQCCDFVACDACFNGIDDRTAQTFLGKVGFDYTCRRGRWYLEAVDYQSGRDWVVGEVDSEETNIHEPPQPQQDADGDWSWVCVFKPTPGSQPREEEK